MAQKTSLIDRLYYANRREYDHTEGNIAYLDGSPLRRPFSMPRMQKLIALVIIAVAIIIGVVFVNSTVLASLRENAQAEEIIAENLKRQPSISTIPGMSTAINMSNDSIREALSAGNTMYDASDPEDPDTMVLYRLPEDVSLDEAAQLYAKGVSNLSGVQASKLLVGSWYFSADRNGGTSMVVRYADFETGDPQKAVQRALEKQGFDPESISESGVDDSGNTFSMGTLDADGTQCTWKISALPLSDMYDIPGLPEDACYVGIRLTVI